MIPFLKKNKDGKKPPKSTVPRTAQESIPFQRMFEDASNNHTVKFLHWQ